MPAGQKFDRQVVLQGRECTQKEHHSGSGTTSLAMRREHKLLVVAEEVGCTKNFAQAEGEWSRTKDLLMRKAWCVYKVVPGYHQKDYRVALWLI